MKEKKIRPFLNGIAAMAVIAALSGVQSAHALEEVSITVDGNTQSFTAPNGQLASGSVTNFHGVTITATSLSNSPNTGGTSVFVLGSTIQVKDVDGLNHTVVISVGDTNFAAPTTPPALSALSSISGTVVIGGTSSSTISLQSYINQDNSQNGTTGVTTGLQNTLTQGGLNAAGTYVLANGTATVGSLSTGYSMTSVTDISLKAGANFNVSTQVSLTSVPEPSTMAIAGLGALGMIGYGLRRRKALGA